jgi:hypothetical protein
MSVMWPREQCASRRPQKTAFSPAYPERQVRLVPGRAAGESKLENDPP